MKTKTLGCDELSMNALILRGNIMSMGDSVILSLYKRRDVWRTSRVELPYGKGGSRSFYIYVTARHSRGSKKGYVTVSWGPRIAAVITMRLTSEGYVVTRRRTLHPSDVFWGYALQPGGEDRLAVHGDIVQAVKAASGRGADLDYEGAFRHATRNYKIF